ncbi:hypothetical protein VPNG_07226, partial [Cytospora leucostoma]
METIIRTSEIFTLILPTTTITITDAAAAATASAAAAAAAACTSTPPPSSPPHPVTIHLTWVPMVVTPLIAFGLARLGAWLDRRLATPPAAAALAAARPAARPAAGPPAARVC